MVSGSVVASSTWIPLEATALDQAMLLLFAAGTDEAFRPARLLQCSLTLLLGAVEPLERRQREAFLELDRAAGHTRTGICVPLYDPRAAIEE